MKKRILLLSLVSIIILPLSVSALSISDIKNSFVASYHALATKYKKLNITDYIYNSKGTLKIKDTLKVTKKATFSKDATFKGDIILDSGAKVDGVDISDLTTATTLSVADGSGLSLSDNVLSIQKTCTDGQILEYNSTNSAWECSEDTATITGSSMTIGSGLVLSDAGTLSVSGVTSAMITDATIETGDIKENAVTTSKINDGAVGTNDLAANAVTTSKINDGAVGTNDLDANVVTSAKISDGTIVVDDIASGAVTTDKISDGTIATGDIASSAVTTDKISDGTIAAGDIADSAVSTLKIADSTITLEKLQDQACEFGKVIKNNGMAWECGTDDNTTYSAATSGGLTQNGTEFGIKLNGSTLAVSSSGVSVNAITTDQITDLTIATIDLTDNAVTDAKVVPGLTISGGTINSSTIGSSVPSTIAATTLSTSGLANLQSLQINSRARILPALSSTSSSNINTTVDNTADDGDYMAMAIGVDGLPIIAYHELNSGIDYLKVMHCNDAVCAGGDETITSVDGGSGNLVGTYPTVTIENGLPFISYYDITDGNINGYDCTDVACTAGTVAFSSGASGNYGQYSSVAINSDGFPMISYYHAGDLYVFDCSAANCTAGSVSSLELDLSSVDNGKYTSIALGVDNLPIIAYYDETNDDLKTIHCGANVIACDGSNTITTLISAGSLNDYSSMTIGNDGYPIIAYHNLTAGAHSLNAYHCTAVDCSAGSNYSLDSTGNIGSYTAITIGNTGYPVISYYGTTNTELKASFCSNVLCSTANNVSLVGSGVPDYGAGSSIAISTDGLPVVAYRDTTNTALRVFKSANIFGLDYWSRR